MFLYTNLLKLFFCFINSTTKTQHLPRVNFYLIFKSFFKCVCVPVYECAHVHSEYVVV